MSDTADVTSPPRVAVRAEPMGDPALRDAAARWARRLTLPELTRAPEPFASQPPGARDDIDMLVLVTPEGLALRALRGPEALTRGKPVRIDLHRLDTTTGHGRSLRQPLLRAVGLRKGDPTRPSVLDATAGLGEDAWLLASSGCPVLAVERHPIVAALLEEAIERAVARSSHAPRSAPNASASSALPRITTLAADSLALLEHLGSGASLLDWPEWGASASTREPTHEAECATGRARREAVRAVIGGAGGAEGGAVKRGTVDVVYIDPMFPPGRKAAERKPLLMLRALVGADPDAAALLAPARRAARRRVVVKRPRHAAPLADAPPAATHHGRAVRYDVYPADERA